jgi:hypothetical protein
MRKLTLLLAILMSFGASSIALAGDVSKATTKAQCDEASGVWNADTKTCSDKM